MSGALEYGAQVADMMFDRGVVKFAGVGDAPAEGFKLKLHEKDPSAPLSPIYLNIRAEGHKDGTLRPEDFGLIADLLVKATVVQDLDFRFLAGIPVAGEPIADAMFEKLRATKPNLVQLHLVKEEKEGGRSITGIVEDLWATGSILLVDDLITKADTKLEAIAVCEEAGLEVEAVVVLVDREQGGTDEIESIGHDLIAALMLSELLVHYVETGRIDRSKADEVEQYLVDNQV